MPEVAYDIPSLDMAMRLGYNWDLGRVRNLGRAG
jgi:hypothetical protein